MFRKKLSILGCIALCFFAAPTLAGSSHSHGYSTMEHGSLVIENIMIRAVPDTMRVTAGFLKITNKGNQEDRLMDITADFAGRSELHTMAMENGIMKMRPLVDGIVIPAGGEVILEPGGLHLMFMKMTSVPALGDMKEVTLHFELAGPITLMVPVKKIKHSH